MGAEAGVDDELLAALGLGELEQEDARGEVVDVGEAEGDELRGELVGDYLERRGMCECIEWLEGCDLIGLTFTSKDEKRCFMVAANLEEQILQTVEVNLRRGRRCVSTREVRDSKSRRSRGHVMDPTSILQGASFPCDRST